MNSDYQIWQNTDWEKFIKNPQKHSHEKDYRVWRFLALAYLDSKYPEKSNRETLDSLARRKLGVQYNAITINQKELLQRELPRYGISLLQTSLTCQYLRTIQRLSGSMYIKFTELIAKEPWDNLAVEGKIEQLIENKLQQYQNGAEDGVTKEDIADFFRSLIALYRQTNTMFSANDICRQNSAIRREVAQQIVDKMQIQKSGDAETFEELRPQIAFSSNNDSVFLSSRWKLPAIPVVRPVQYSM